MCNAPMRNAWESLDLWLHGLLPKVSILSLCLPQIEGLSWKASFRDAAADHEQIPSVSKWALAE